MNAVVVHHTLNSVGGETTVAIETIEALNELGYEVDLVTAQKPDMERISKAYGKQVRVREMFAILPFQLNYLGIYQRLLTNVAIPSSVLRKADLIFNTHGGGLFPVGVDSKVPFMTYLHFPAELIVSALPNGNGKYQQSYFWNAYF
ncbi:MAG TPA: hypothetical protein VFA15_08030, partial [Nitrososphaera sp.]|nr:hypothetical protein [Nitrososphaera sp.]